MRYDINRIDHSISSFKAEMRNMRLLLVRYGGEIKELRRRLDESETKNLELLANINQLGFGAPSVDGPERTESVAAAAAATIKQCSMKPRPAASMLKRLYPDTESHSSCSTVVPSSSSSSSLEGNEAEPQAQDHEGGSSAAKKVKISD